MKKRHLMVDGHRSQQAKKRREQQHGQERVFHKGEPEGFQGKQHIHEGVDSFHQIPTSSASEAAKTFLNSREAKTSSGAPWASTFFSSSTT